MRDGYSVKPIVTYLQYPPANQLIPTKWKDDIKGLITAVYPCDLYKIQLLNIISSYTTHLHLRWFPLQTY